MAVPTTTIIEPSSGPCGLDVVITGTGFTGVKGVRFGATLVGSNWSVVDDTCIVALVPPGTGTRTVQVQNADGWGGAVQFTQATYPGGTGSAPTVTDINPNTSTNPEGWNEGGDTVTVTGTGFSTAWQVLFGDAPAVYTVNAGSDTTLVATAPAGYGYVDVKVYNSYGFGVCSEQFLYPSRAVPVFTSMIPQSGVAGTKVTVTGTGLLATNQVTFVRTDGDTTPYDAQFEILSDTTLDLWVPVRSDTDAVCNVFLVNDAGSSSDPGTGNNFTYTASLGPVTTASNLASNPFDDWVAGPVTVTLTAVDDGGPGIDATYYRIDGGTTQTYTAPFQISVGVHGVGSHMVEYWSTSLDGRVEGAKTGFVNLVVVSVVPTGLQVTPGIGALYASWTTIVQERPPTYKVYWGPQNPPTAFSAVTDSNAFTIKRSYSDGLTYVAVSSTAYNGTESAKCTAVSATALATSTELADDSITLAKLAPEIIPPVLYTGASLPSLPNTLYPEGTILYWTNYDTLYKTINGTTWVKLIATIDIQDDAITMPKLATGIQPPVVVSSLPTLPNADYPAGSIVFLTSDSCLYKTTTGLVGSWVKLVATADIQDDAITYAKFATGIQPPGIVSSLPTLPHADYPAGSIVFLTSDSCLYKTTTGLVGSWVKLVGSGDIIADSITAGQIAAGAIGVSELAANSVIAEKMVISDFTNLNQNWQFRAVPDFVGWTGAGANWTIVTDTMPDGVSGPVVQLTPAGTTYDLNNQIIECQENDQFYGSCYIKKKVQGADTSGQLGIGLSVMKTDGTWAYPALVSYTDISTMTVGTWYKIEGSAVMPALSRYVRYRLSCRDTVANGTFQWAFPVFRRKNAGELIVDGSITTDKLAANAVTAAKIDANTITAGQIATGAITADELAANSVYSRNLVVASFDNLVPNPTSEADLTGAVVDAIEGVGVTSADAFAGTKCRAVAGAGTVNPSLYITPWVPVQAGEEYYYSAMARLTTLTGSGARFAIAVNTRQDGSGTTSWGSASYKLGTSWGTDPLVPDTYGSYVIPSGYVAMRAFIQWTGTPAAGQYAYFDNLMLRRKNAGSLIVDGAITANKLDALAVTTAKLDALAVTAEKIDVNTITAGQIAAGAIGADEMAANSVFTKNLVVADYENLIPNSNSEATIPTVTPALTLPIAHDSTFIDFRGVNENDFYRGARSRRRVGGGTASGDDAYYIELCRPIPCKVGDKFRFSAWTKCSTAQASYGCRLQIFGLNSAFGEVAADNTLSTYNSTTTWTEQVVTHTVADSTVQYVVARGVYNGTVTTTYGYFDDLLMRKSLMGQLIVDGTLSANAINGGTITGTDVNVERKLSLLSGGVIELAGASTGVIRTAAPPNQRVEMAADAVSSLKFYSGNTYETTHGRLLVFSSGNYAYLAFLSPTLGGAYGALYMTTDYNGGVGKSQLKVDADECIIGNGVPGDTASDTCRVALSGAVTVGPSRRSGQSYELEFLEAVTSYADGADASIWKTAFLGSPTRSITTDAVDHPGYLSVTSQASSNTGLCVRTGWYAIMFNTNTVSPYDYDYAEFVFRVPYTTSTRIRMGFMRGANLWGANNETTGDYGVYINIDGTTLKGRVRMDTVSYDTGTSATITANTWYSARVKILDGATCHFYLYNESGVLQWSANVSYVPTLAAGHGFVAYSTGVSARNVIDMDYMNFFLAPRSR